jgi:hypothetical protein
LFETAIFIDRKKSKRWKFPKLIAPESRGVEARKQDYRQLEEEALRRGKDSLFEKTPGHIHALPLIRAAVPGCRFLIPVRDGRDVAYSMFKRFGDLDKGIRRWIADTGLALEQRGKPDTFVYRHEDLVRSTEPVLRRICNVLQIGFDPRLLRFHETERCWFRLDSLPDEPDNPESLGHREKRAWQVNQPIFDNSGQWAEQFSEADFKQLYSGPGLKIMRAFGYLD